MCQKWFLDNTSPERLNTWPEQTDNFDEQILVSCFCFLSVSCHVNFYVVLNLEGQSCSIMLLELQLLQLSTYSSELQPVKTKTKFYLWHTGEVWTNFSAITTSILSAHGEAECMLLVHSKDFITLCKCTSHFPDNW